MEGHSGATAGRGGVPPATLHGPEAPQTTQPTAGHLGRVGLCAQEERAQLVLPRATADDTLVSSAFTLAIPQFREALRSYAATPWPLEPRHYLSFTEFEITFRPDAGDGTLLYSHDTGSKDFLSVTLAGGHVELRFDCGSGTAILR